MELVEDVPLCLPIAQLLQMAGTNAKVAEEAEPCLSVAKLPEEKPAAGI